jgi:KDO2-lipid IV(A) lauroyltransferase
MKPRIRQFTNWLAPKALSHFKKKLSKKSPEEAERWGERLASIWWRFGGRRKEVAISNLGLAFPEMPLQRRTEIAREVFLHFGRITADFLASSGRPTEELAREMEVEGQEHLERALEKGKGVLMITGHFGNWERSSRWVSGMGYKLSVVARDADQAKVNDAVNDLRQETGTRVIPRGAAARPILERLKANEMVGILPDQNSKEIFIPFFGHLAGTVLGPGVLAERSGAVVLPIVCVRTGVGQYKVIFYPPLEATLPEEKRGEGMMKSINAWLEERIKERPEQWLWIHDRWRSARRKGLL